jgi:pyruvate/2-oxoglutarate dehydrogenase complex dihydrolipoamide acyltransferase (E2) component
MSRELEITLDQAKTAGIVVPSISELQDAGILPTSTEIKKLTPQARTVPLTAEQKKEAARKKITGG